MWEVLLDRSTPVGCLAVSSHGRCNSTPNIKGQATYRYFGDAAVKFFAFTLQGLASPASVIPGAVGFHAVWACFAHILVERGNGRLIHSAAHHLGADDPLLFFTELAANLTYLPVYFSAISSHRVSRAPSPFCSRPRPCRRLHRQELEILVWRFQDIQRWLPFLPYPHLIVNGHAMPQDGFT